MKHLSAGSEVFGGKKAVATAVTQSDASQSHRPLKEKGKLSYARCVNVASQHQHLALSPTLCHSGEPSCQAHWAMEAAGAAVIHPEYHGAGGRPQWAVPASILCHHLLSLPRRL